MWDALIGMLEATWHLTEEMAPYLLLGFLMAGILHLFISQDKVARHLAQNRFSAVLKASLFGIPLPLCSCGVIPVAAHLRKQGANRGPILSFLISTPTTGVDSILATYSLLGPLLAVMRPVAALFSGILTGTLANFWGTDQSPAGEEDAPARSCAVSLSVQKPSWFARLREIFAYAFVDLVKDIAKWLAIGIAVGGLISYWVPATLIENYFSNPLIAYAIMLVIGIPMYVCATGSIPIAASLILKGLSPGAGFIFLFAGPATNTATLSFVGGKMGTKNVAIYLTAILVSGVLFGGLIDFIWYLSGQDMTLISGQVEMLPEWLKTSSAILLLMMMIRPYLPLPRRKISGKGLLLTVKDMTCEHCKKTVDAAVRNVRGVEDVKIDLPGKRVEVMGHPSAESVITAIRQAGYQVEHS